MLLVINKNGDTEPISLNPNVDNFKVSIIVVAKNFTGKWTLQYSPNAIDWFDHEDLSLKTGSATNNLYFQVPYVRVKTTEVTSGEINVYLYGSVS